MMFDRFRAEYLHRRDGLPGGAPWLAEQLLAAEGYAEFAAEFAGASFEGGLYRVHDEQSGPKSKVLVSTAFPDFADRAWPFGYDWLGRQFALDTGRMVDGEPLALLMEPGTGEVLEVPVSFASFHNEELLDYADAALATKFFEDW